MHIFGFSNKKLLIKLDLSVMWKLFNKTWTCIGAYLLLVLQCLGFSMQYNFRDVFFALFNLPKYKQNIRRKKQKIQVNWFFFFKIEVEKNTSWSFSAFSFSRSFICICASWSSSTLLGSCLHQGFLCDGQQRNQIRNQLQ